MGSRNFRELLEARWAEGKFVCVGLDSDLSKIPADIRDQKGEVEETLFMFNRMIVDATADLACAFKLNIAFYAKQGTQGLFGLMRTVAYIHQHFPEVPVILDAKRADIGNTNLEYVGEAFEVVDADAVTVHPYLGREALQPFLDQKDKGIIVLCKTSNKGAGEFQDLTVSLGDGTNGTASRCEIERHLGREIVGRIPLHQYVAFQIATGWNKNGNCGLVVGATYPEDLKIVREIAPDMPLLVPGIGKQGGDLEKTVAAGMDSRGRGMIINSSSGIIFASDGPDFADAARRETEKLHAAISDFRAKYGKGVE